tara:strand:+ start:204 stop:485 length:282 start_codon:yes stop_codon:yes gene_type:complete
MDIEERLANLEAEHMLVILKTTAVEVRLDEALSIIADLATMCAEMDQDVHEHRDALNRYHAVISGLIDEGERMDNSITTLIEAVADPLGRMGF